MKFGRDILGRQTMPVTQPKDRQYVAVYHFADNRNKRYPFSVMFYSGNDWVQSVELSESGMRHLRDSIDKALRHTNGGGTAL